MAKNPELPNMPKPDRVGTVAQNFRTCLEKQEAIVEEKGELMLALVKAMRNAKRASIQIDGYRFEVLHTGPKDGIKVTKPK